MQYSVLSIQIAILVSTLAVIAIGCWFASRFGKAIHKRITRNAVKAERARIICLSCLHQINELKPAHAEKPVRDSSYVSLDLPSMTLDPGGRTGEMIKKEVVK